MGLFDKLKNKVAEINVDELKNKVNIESLKDKINVDSLKEKVSIDSLKEKVSIGSLKEKISDSKPMMIGYVANINYDKALDAVNKIGGKYPETVGIIRVLQRESAGYNESQQENKEDVFISNVINSINPDNVLNEIEPIVSYIPHGNYLVMFLKYLAKKKQK